MAVTLLCTVRACGLLLSSEERSLVCGSGHRFDVARSGYVNLLQPQDRRSKSPGDSAAAVGARRSFLDRGFAAPLVAGLIASMEMRRGAALLDAGCGEGHHTMAFRKAWDVETHGLDISIPAIDLAAKRDRDCVWIVANADRLLPYPDATFDAVTSITARLNPAEYGRVLKPGGQLLLALPGPDDLIELREAVLGEGIHRDRVERTLETFAPQFELVRRTTLRHVAELDKAAIVDVMSSSYRGLRSREREKLDGLSEAVVTLSRDVLLLAVRSAP